MNDNSIVVLGCRGSDGFLVESKWAKMLKGDGILCSHCEWIIDGQLSKISAVQILDAPGTVHFGLIFGFYGGVILSAQMVELVRSKSFLQQHVILPIKRGDMDLKDYLFIARKRENGCIRGYPASVARKCRLCKRLLYSPTKAKYLLKDYWPKLGNLVVFGTVAVVQSNLYDQTINPLNLRRLTAEKIGLTDLPSDGLPISFSALKKQVRTYV